MPGKLAAGAEATCPLRQTRSMLLTPSFEEWSQPAVSSVSSSRVYLNYLPEVTVFIEHPFLTNDQAWCWFKDKVTSTHNKVPQTGKLRLGLPLG